MAVRPNSTPASSGVSPVVIIATIAVVLILIGGLAWHAFGSHGGGAPTRPLTTDEIWVNQKAKDTSGDFTKLSQTDQRRLYALDGVQAPFMLRQAAHELQNGK